MAKKLSEGALWWLAWAVITGSLALILLARRPTPPSQALGLQYSLSEAEEVQRNDSELAKQELSADTKRLLELTQNQNLSQLGRMPPSWDYDSEAGEMRQLLTKLKAGETDSLARLRARIAGQSLAALTGEMSVEDAEKTLGGSIEKLRQYQLAVGRRLRAPGFVIRTFYKARLNQLLGLPPIDGMTEVEQHAHYGWPAFHARQTPPPQRAQVLDAYQKSGGERAGPARAQLLLAAGSLRAAAEAYEKLAERTGNLRYRNHALFVYEKAKERASAR